MKAVASIAAGVLQCPSDDAAMRTMGARALSYNPIYGCSA